MAIRIKWDQYEAALLIDTFWKIEASPERKDQLIKQLSIDLRNKAISKGIEIDDVYRNVNGISMQLIPIAHAFYPERPTLTSSIMFEKMVQMYNENRDEFDKILDEAKRLIDHKNAYEDSQQSYDFELWLKKKEIKKYSEDSIVNAIENASEYCLSHKLLDKSIWKLEDQKTFISAIHRLLSERSFRVMHKKDLHIMERAIALYKTFLEEKVCSASDVTADNGATLYETEDREDRKNYFHWLIYDRSLSKTTSRAYVSAINMSEKYAKENIAEDCMLFSATEDVIRMTAAKLFSDVGFRGLNAIQHNRYIISLRLFLEYMGIEIEQSTDTSNIVMLLNEDGISDTYEHSEIARVLEAHFLYGFNYNSPIEMIKFKKYFWNDIGEEISDDGESLIELIKKIGFEYDRKIYVIQKATVDHIADVIRPHIESGKMIFYYDQLFSSNEKWLFEGRVVSGDMLKSILMRILPSYQYRPNFFIARNKRYTEQEALIEDIELVWGDSVLRIFDELCQELPFVPRDKIKYALTVGDNFVWNSFETYTRRDRFIITEEQVENIISSAALLCDEKGSALFEDLPLDDVISENYQLSETAIYENIFSFMKNQFSRNGKAVTKKGEKIDITSEIVNYCRVRDTCTMQELEQLMFNLTGEIRYPIVIEAANSVMVRIDKDTLVADQKLQFDIDKIDSVLDEMIQGNVMGMKVFTSFATLPYCGYPWNHFVLESYCRRFSKLFKYGCITPNSKNAGAIIRKECDISYDELMSEAVARSGVSLNEKDVFDYLISSGLLLKRLYSNMDVLLLKAADIREGRN